MLSVIVLRQGYGRIRIKEDWLVVKLQQPIRPSRNTAPPGEVRELSMGGEEVRRHASVWDRRG